MRMNHRVIRIATHVPLAAAAFAALPALIAACGARTGIDDPGAPASAPPEAGPDATPVDRHGCADGTREAFVDRVQYPDIAGCAGAFSVPGIFPDAPPACGRKAGNTASQPFGEGCGASDLCSAGFHVCHSAADVQKRSPDGCAGAVDAPPASFFATGQSGPGCGFCATGTNATCTNSTCKPGCLQTNMTTNDIFGCGTVGNTPDPGSCGVLDRFSYNFCAALPSTWSCPGDGTGELLLVTKTGPGGGGVLCCRD